MDPLRPPSVPGAFACESPDEAAAAAATARTMPGWDGNPYDASSSDLRALVLEGEGEEGEDMMREMMTVDDETSVGSLKQGQRKLLLNVS